MLFEDTLSACVLVFGARRLQKGQGEDWKVSWADGFVIPFVSPSVIVW